MICCCRTSHKFVFCKVCYLPYI